jgi:hypothetical protein
MLIGFFGVAVDIGVEMEPLKADAENFLEL